MKVGPVSPMPWDMVVFLTITTAGFGFSVKKVMNHTVAHPVAAEESSEASVEVIPGQSSSKTLDLGCLESRLRGERVTSQDGAIRLRGKICHMGRMEMKQFDGMTVKNLSNGYEGTIFLQGYDNSFVSDFVVLQSGKNEIQLEWRESKTAPPQALVTEVFEK